MGDGKGGNRNGLIFMSNLFLQHFEKDFTNEGPSWIQDIRKKGIESFANLGYPTSRQEAWKYTSVKPIAEISFKRATPSGSSEITADKLMSLPFGILDAIRIVFVNGHYAPKLSSISALPKGVKIESLAQVLKEDPHSVEPHLTRHATYKDHPFVALNTAFIEDGAFIFLPVGTILEKPIHLLFISQPNGEATVSYPRNLVIAQEASQAAIVESYVGWENNLYFTNAVTEIVAADSAFIDHYKLQQESQKAFHLASVAIHQGRESNYNSHSISLGGGLTRNEISTVLDAEGAECLLNGLYLVSDRQHVDNQTSIDHVKPHCTSLEIYKGILDGSAQGVFNGKILVRPDAQKTQARQTNNNLILSNDALVNTKPLLEIYNNDVKCNHGATIGRLDENQIFYLRSRGISEARARSLLTYAFASDIIGRMKIESLKTRLQEFIFAQLMKGQMSPKGLGGIA
jgi:Fe-S cluster assembly protein SufD